MRVRILNPASFDIIQSVTRLASNPPDPETSVTNATRATTIFGRMLETIADKNFERASPLARRITQLGMLSYGLVELSVPRSFAELLFIYWLKLFFLVGVILTALGVVLQEPAVWHLGFLVLLLVWATDSLRCCLRRFMQTGHFPLRTLGERIALLVVVLVLGFPGSLIQFLQSMEGGLRLIVSVHHHLAHSLHLVAS